MLLAFSLQKRSSSRKKVQRCNLSVEIYSRSLHLEAFAIHAHPSCRSGQPRARITRLHETDLTNPLQHWFPWIYLHLIRSSGFICVQCSCLNPFTVYPIDGLYKYQNAITISNAIWFQSKHRIHNPMVVHKYEITVFFCLVLPLLFSSLASEKATTKVGWKSKICSEAGRKRKTIHSMSFNGK